MEKKLFVLLISFFVFISFSVAQQKYEKEYRIKESSVPESARDFIHSQEIDKKIKWFLEESLTGRSIEAKFKFQKRKYSIEFDTLGNLQDVEIEYRTSEIPEGILNEIEKHISDNYQKHKIQKIQIHYAGDIPSLQSFIKTKKPEEVYQLKYELVVKARKDNLWKLYEMIFDDRGMHLKTSRIILRNTDNLEF